MAQRRLFVTGGWGFLGRAVVRHANSAGWIVFEPSHRELDIRDEDVTRRAIVNARPNAVIHTAYRQDGPDAWSTNVDGTAAVARAASACGARLIHVSSDAVFGGRTTPYSETDEPTPVNDYGRSKAAAEAHARMVEAGCAIVRTSLLYDREHVARQHLAIFDSASGRSDCTFFTDEIRSFTNVDDLASAMLDLCFHDHRGPLHVAGPEPMSRYEFARRYAAFHRLDPDRLTSGTRAEHGEARPGVLVLDSSKATGMLTTRMRSVSEVLSLQTR